MTVQANIAGLTWDFTIPKTISKSQKWVLSAMHKHGPELVTLLWRILGNEQDVCDAYQDTFLNLAHCESGVKPECVKAYLFRTATNAAITLLRRRIIERKNLFRDSIVKRNTKSPSSELDSKFLQERLRDSISRLPEHLRIVITLRDFGELSYAQVAKVLGITSATARVYRCKAIQLLSVLMNKEE